MIQTNTSILARFPEYGFKSTTVYNKRSLGRKWLMALYVFLLVFGGFLICVGIVSLILYILNINHPDVAGFTFLTLFVIFLIFTMPSLVLGWYKKGILTSSFAEYIQTKGERRFFIQNGKFGLINWRNFRIIIPAIYDKLMWVQENEVMKASLNGQEFLIDIHNNKLS